MEETFDSVERIDHEKIRTSIKLHTPIEITTYTLPRNMEVYINEVLAAFLTECNQQHMIEYLTFCLGELLTNSKKANTKRIYFKEHNLDLNVESDYVKGMETFKMDTLNNIDYYLTEQKKAGLYIKLVLQFTDDNIRIEIRNNSLLCPHERQRIQEKLDNAKQYKSEKDVFGKLIDQTEGAGLGIIIIVLMLQKIGLSKDNYKVYTNETETVTAIELPIKQEIQEGLDTVCNDFIQLQRQVPVIDSELEELEELIADTPAEKKKLINKIADSVSLSALVLKNAVKIVPDCCEVSKAVDVLGAEKLKKILNKDNPEIRIIQASEFTDRLWTHARTTAIFAYNIAKNFPIEKKYSLEEIYVFGLLHDIECVLMEVSSPEEKELIRHKCERLNVSEQIYHMISNFSYHGSTGAKVVKSWGLPDKLAAAIKYHNNPDHAPEEIKKLIAIIYLADILQYFDSKDVDFYQINKNILKLFNIESEEKLFYILNQVKSIL